MVASNLLSGEALIQDVVPSRALRVRNAVLVLSLIAVGCTALYAVGKGEQQAAQSGISMITMPMNLPMMRQSVQPAKMPAMQIVQATKQKDKKWPRSVLQNLKGTAEKPRLAARTSNNHVYAQLIDDQNARTLLALSSLSKDDALKGKGKNKETSKLIGQMIADKAAEMGIFEAVFDRGPHRFHGNIAELAAGAREKGLLDKENPNRQGPK